MVPLLLAVCISTVYVGGLAAFQSGVWLYFIPLTLALFLGWLHILDVRNRSIVNRILRDHPDLLSSDEQEMLILNRSLFVPRSITADSLLLVQRGMAPAIDGMRIVAMVYGVTCMGLRAWGPAVLSISLLLYALLGPLANAFDAWNRLDSTERAVYRYVSHLRRQHGLSEEDVPRVEVVARAHYASVDRKLHSLLGASDGSRPVDRSTDSVDAALDRSARL